MSSSRHRRLAWSALLPRVGARWSRTNGQYAAVDLDAASAGRWYSADRWEIRATWDLGRLVFDRRELAVAAAAHARARRREALLARVSALFAERERLRAVAPTSSGRERAHSIALARVEAQLDELTAAPK